mgnify:CR=1 FL=1
MRTALLIAKPGSAPVAACTDPDRANNVPATSLMTVLDSPKVYGVLPAGATLTPSFTIQMAASITGTQKVDMLIGVTAKSGGKGVETAPRQARDRERGRVLRLLLHRLSRWAA